MFKAWPSLQNALPSHKLKLATVTLLTTKKVANADLLRIEQKTVIGVGESFFAIEKLEIVNDLSHLIPEGIYATIGKPK